jgi:hypothetical protein
LQFHFLVGHQQLVDQKEWIFPKAQRAENKEEPKIFDPTWRKSKAEGLPRSCASVHSPDLKYVMTILHFSKFKPTDLFTSDEF